jgi:hypothetical protein
MRRLLLLSVTWLVACASPAFQQQRLQDGSFKVTCELAMDECMRRAQDLCSNQRFRILEGTSETRLQDAPPFERANHTSRIHLKCTTDGASPLLSLDPTPAPLSSSTAPAPAAPACTIGETRACVGPGACQGGQVCLATRAGFGSCDCGAATTPPPVPPPALPSDSAAAPSPASAPGPYAPPTSDAATPAPSAPPGPLPTPRR